MDPLTVACWGGPLHGKRVTWHGPHATVYAAVPLPADYCKWAEPEPVAPTRYRTVRYTVRQTSGVPLAPYIATCDEGYPPILTTYAVEVLPLLGFHHLTRKRLI